MKIGFNLNRPSADAFHRALARVMIAQLDERPIEEVAPQQAQQIEPPTATPERNEQVRNSIEQLRSALTQVVSSVYQMQLTSEQMAELTEKVLVNLSDEISAVTLERIKEIANEQLVSAD